jgi:hypothetical protein
VVLTLFDDGFLAASLVAGYASATSPLSVALTVSIVIAALDLKWRFAHIGGYVLVSGAGALACMTYLWSRFGDPLAFLAQRGRWHRSSIRSIDPKSQLDPSDPSEPGPGKATGQLLPRTCGLGADNGRRGGDLGHDVADLCRSARLPEPTIPAR